MRAASSARLLLQLALFRGAWCQVDPVADSGGACGSAGSGGSAGPPGAATVRHGQTFGTEHFVDDQWHNRNCHWVLECSGGTATVTFVSLVTENNFDFVNVFDDASLAGVLTGSTGSAGNLGRFDSSSAAAALAAPIEGATLVQYITDASVLSTPSGFTATLSCTGGYRGVDLQSGFGKDWCDGWRTEECGMEALTQAVDTAMATEVRDPRVTSVFSIQRREDSAEELVSTATPDLGSSDLVLMHVDAAVGGQRSEGEQVVGVVFPRVTIPNSAAVSSATIIFNVGEVRPGQSDLPVRVKIYGEANSMTGAAPPTAALGDLSNRTATTFSVMWDVPSAGDAGDALESPDISLIVTEITSDPSW